MGELTGFLPRLIVLGASVRAAVHSSLWAGYAPYAIDCYADLDVAAVCQAEKIDRYPHGFLAAIRAAPHVPWMYTGGLENHPRLIDRLAEIRPLAGNAGSVLQRIRDPQQLALVAAAAGCPLPRIGEGQSLLLKPARGSGGVAIRFARSSEIARPPRGRYLQEHVAGEAASAVFVAANRRATLLGATRQLLGSDFELPRPFLYVGSLGPLPLHDDEQSALRRLGADLAAQFSLTGLFNVDFVRTERGIRTIEVNPRYSASIEVLERATGQRSVALHLAACNAGTIPDSPYAGGETCWAKAIVYAECQGVVCEKLTDLIASWNLGGRPPLLADLPRPGELIQKDQPVLTVFAEGRSLAETEAALRRRVQLVKQTLAL